MSADVSVGTDLDVDRSQLRHLCRAGQTNNIKELGEDLLRNAINSRDPITGYTALHSAAIFNRLDVIQLLLDYGAEIDIAGYRDGQTPFMKMARYAGGIRQIQCAQLLIEYGADINYQDNHGNTGTDEIYFYAYTFLAVKNRCV